MIVTLQILSGTAKGTKVELRPGQSVIVGRAERASLVLHYDPYLSARHLLIECDHDTCYLRDLNSTNGTWLNDRRIEASQLADGDVVVAGKTVLGVRIAATEEQAANPVPRWTKTVMLAPDAAPAPATNGRSSIRDRVKNEDLQRLALDGDTSMIPPELIPPAPADRCARAG